MTGTITYILSRAGYRAMNGPLADERRRLAGAEPPAAYVSYDPRLLAGAGWYGYRIALKGGDRQMLELARYMLSERYVIRDGYEYYSDGVYVFGVLLRERVPHYGIGGGVEPTPDPDVLNFYMPNGGTISLNKIGSPTVVELEYWLSDDNQWRLWEADSSGNRSLTLTAGQTMYVRNTSNAQTNFSTSDSYYYRFVMSNDCAADGNINSLVIKKPNGLDINLPNYCFYKLFYLQPITKAPLCPSRTIGDHCYENMFMGTKLTSSAICLAEDIGEYGCLLMYSNIATLEEAETPHATVLGLAVYKWMFDSCSNLRKITLHATQLLNTNPTPLYQWVYGVSPTGDFYCPAELTIPTNSSGIPRGWTRHDI